jgi:hypothetical protein
MEDQLNDDDARWTRAEGTTEAAGLPRRIGLPRTMLAGRWTITPHDATTLLTR